MNVEIAKQILLYNYKGAHDTFMYFLHEKNYFSKEAF